MSTSRASNTNSPINSFRGNYDWLSNFYPAPVQCDAGIRYPSVEHAYQASKTLDLAVRDAIAALLHPAEAKYTGSELDLRGDWYTARLDIMLNLVRQKFTKHADLQHKLLATGDRQLIEVNGWGDQFWGVSRGTGRNHLGRILMRVRNELRA